MDTTLKYWLLLLSLVATPLSAEQKLGVMEVFVRGGGEYCIAAAPSLIALQDAMKERAVILEYPYDSFREGRVERFFSAYTGPSPYLPLVMVGSGYAVAQGPVDYATRYRQMLDWELLRPPRAGIQAWVTRSGPRGVEVFATITNNGTVTFWNTHRSAGLIVWENTPVGLTRTFVRATAAQAFTALLAPGESANVGFAIANLFPAEWNNVRALVLLDEFGDSCGCTNRWDMMQAAIAKPAALVATPPSITLDPAAPEATIALGGPHVLGWSASTDASWLSVTPPAGAVPGTATIRLAGTPAAGTEATVRFTASGGGMAFSADVGVRATGGGGTTMRPFPQHVAYAPGTIRPAARTQAQQDDDVRAYYDVWKCRYLAAAGTAAGGSPLYRVSFGSTDPARTISRGQGYGMMIAAWMAGHDPEAQAIFDGLWRFARLHPSPNDSRLMNREVPAVTDRAGSSFEGDADIAYALLLADAQWGSSGGIDYRGDAETLLDGILASTIGPQSHLPTLGDWVGFGGATYNQYTPRSSDLMIDHFRAFAAATRDPQWAQAVTASQAVIRAMQASHSQETGLLPGFIIDAGSSPAQAPAGFLEGAADGHCGRDAARVPWRVGFDALVSGDRTSAAQARKIAQWAAEATAGDPSAFRSGYALDGTPLPGSDDFSISFVAPLGVAAMTDPAGTAWLDAIYESVRATHEDCYEDSVTLLSMLAMSGNAWPPPMAMRRRLVRSW
jgi:endoglucanase